LFEVGCEEIPARFLADAERDLGRNVATALREARLLEESLPAPQTYSTPRRLVVWVPEVLACQPDTVEEVIGPPVNVAFDSEGRPTRAAESFASKNGAAVGDLVLVSTAKGQYAAVRRRIRGHAAGELLPEILPAALAQLRLPKDMYWLAKTGPYFVRPIRWILALLGEGKAARPVVFEYGGVKSGSLTHGARVAGRQPVAPRSFNLYLKRLRESFVEIDSSVRRATVIEKSKALLEGTGGKIVDDPWLLDWVVNSTEWPVPLLGDFDERFLRLPREILISVMRDHQKYFAVEDPQGTLQPRFVAVANAVTDRHGWIRQGHRRVLAARFRDAEFFWETDQRLPLQDRRALLQEVTYQAELGTYAEKVERMQSLAGAICKALQEAGMFDLEASQHALRGTELAKCDLTTQMVKEFPNLQGIVGGLYARVQGEPQPVWEAIYDHYLPQGLEGDCPRSSIGAVVSLADKIDSLVGGFAVGREPTGSSDPYALRRAGNGIIRLLLELSLPVNLRKLIEHAASVLMSRAKRGQPELVNAVWEFLAERLRYYLESVRSLRYDTVRAVLAAGWDVPLDALRRAEVLEATRGSDNFLALSVAAKRIKNILAKSASAEDWQAGAVDPACLRERAEQELYAAYQGAAAETDDLRRRGSYKEALEVIARLRPTVDRFFDQVLVMAEDPQLRQNRLRLLDHLDRLLSSIAHFAEIVAGPVHVDASTSTG